MTTTSLRRVSAMLLIAGFSAFDVAQAQDVDPAARAQAQLLYDNGAALYEEGQYERAIQAWQEAYRLSREPGLLYNIANAHERLGHLQQAIDTLNEYRVYAPEAERETTMRRLRTLEQRIAEQQATPPPAPPPAAVSEPAPPTAAAEPAQPPPPKATTSHPKRIAGIVLASLGAGTAGAASGLYSAAAGSAATARELCVDGANGWLCQAEAEDPASRSTALATGGHASWAVAGALIASGVALIALDGSDHRVVVLPTPLRGGAGLALIVSL